MQSIISPEKLLANRNNATLSTGPKSKKGKLKVGKNAISHGLNQASNYPDEPLYKALLIMIEAAGFDGGDIESIAMAIIDYRKVMDTYYEAYTNIPDVNNTYNDNRSFISEAIYGMAEGAGDNVSNEEIQAMIRLLQHPGKQKQQKELLPIDIGTELKRFIRYQRKAAASISKAICKK
jgi:hypothetical protein